MPTLLAKTCCACGVLKMTAEYQKNQRKRLGTEPQCRDCNNARIRANYRRDPASKIAKTRQYHLDNPEWSKERLHAWYERNRTEVLAADRARRASGDVEWLDRKRDATRRKESERRAQKAGSQIEVITGAVYDELFLLWGGMCWICAAVLDDETPATWDHVQPLAAGGAHIRENLRPACGPCNSRKNSRWPFTEQDRLRIAHEVSGLTPRAR